MGDAYAQKGNWFYHTSTHLWSLHGTTKINSNILKAQNNDLVECIIVSCNNQGNIMQRTPFNDQKVYFLFSLWHFIPIQTNEKLTRFETPSRLVCKTVSTVVVVQDSSSSVPMFSSLTLTSPHGFKLLLSLGKKRILMMLAHLHWQLPWSVKKQRTWLLPVSM